ncbi:hypothetical protein OHA70_08565 [Kribbella sp. NBC_00382]|uniref:hypothetical protein n=1 Tax=Kribbella sp. NBC_00382 TaxID=2975967 RepID=UPI002E1D067A
MPTPAQNRRCNWWTAIGVVVLVVVNVVWSRLAGHSEWTDSAIYGSPIAALIGAAAGWGAAVLAERRAR